MGLEELLFHAALLGAPLGLLWISWHRYRTISGAGRTHGSLALASLALVTLSSGIWLLFYALVQIDDYSKTARSILNLIPTTATLAVTNLLVCLVSFILSLLMPKVVQGTIPLKRALICATSYMVLIWMFALTLQH